MNPLHYTIIALLGFAAPSSYAAETSNAATVTQVFDSVESITRISSAFEILRKEYVSSPDMPSLTEAAIKSVRAAATDIPAEEWNACIAAPNNLHETGNISNDLMLVITAINCTRSSRLKTSENIDMTDVAIKSMVAQLDANSRWLGPKDILTMRKTATKADIGYTGLSMYQSEGRTIIYRTGYHTPARQAGIEAGDLLLAIDGKSTASLTLDQVIDLCRGPVGSKVVLTISTNSSRSRDVLLERQIFSVETEIDMERRDDFLVARINSLPPYVGETFRRMLKEQKSPVSGLIIDLRGNAGGLLGEALMIADQFLEKGVIVQSKGRREQEVETLYAKRGQLLPNVPIIILVDRNTASGAEIIASALQDHGRAIVMGKTTLGAGTIQSVFPINDRYFLKLTTSYEYRPNGNRIVDSPVIPDCPTGIEKEELITLSLKFLKSLRQNCAEQIN